MAMRLISLSLGDIMTAIYGYFLDGSNKTPDI